MNKKYLLVSEESPSWNAIKEHLYRLFFERREGLEFDFYALGKRLDDFREYGTECFETDDDFGELFKEAIELAKMQNFFSFEYGEHEEKEE